MATARAANRMGRFRPLPEARTGFADGKPDDACRAPHPGLTHITAGCVFRRQPVTSTSGVARASAIVFPGMGPTGYSDVARFMLTNPAARELTAVANEVLGYHLVDRFSVSDNDYSVPAQVAFLVNCLALVRHAEDNIGVRPDYCAGPSFGAKPATAYTGALTFADTVRMTAALAQLTEDYFRTEHQDVVTHSFVRTPPERLRELLAEMDGRDEWYEISAHIDDDFYMLTLREGGLDQLQRRVRAMGGLPLYTMRPPAHSAAFGVLRARAEQEVFEELRFGDPSLPVVSDHDGELVKAATGMRNLLLDEFVRPLRWPVVVNSLQRLQVDRVVVCGPDGLFSRVAITRRAFEVIAVNPQFAMLPGRQRPGATGA